MPKSRPAEIRFWEKVNKTPGHGPWGDCWIWTAAKDTSGYGHMLFGKKIVKAHRIAWMLEKGPIPDGLDCLHKCDVSLCVRVEHLWLGTQVDNTLDCERKGRAIHPKGDDHGCAKITEQDVLWIRSHYQHNAAGRWHDGDLLGLTALSKKYGVTKQAIRAIVIGKTWKHLPLDGINKQV